MKAGDKCIFIDDDSYDGKEEDSAFKKGTVVIYTDVTPNDNLPYVRRINSEIDEVASRKLLRKIPKELENESVETILLYFAL